MWRSFPPSEKWQLDGSLDFEEVQSSWKVKNKLESSACLLDVKSIDWQNTNLINS